ncbi:glycosyl hydrolase family 18 protein [Microbacterium elymi]|uniref:Glycosyl hydrolase family 18 protein n=1 Tax=Microbacterium elymi TaxID=2909587 RepID=A0ABY5NH11_9MICO|nr:glycosyl hydrolase family 18 protein [Microbacterium elymi]UUT34426.1 glycosyl hydrolase family 18 protein [Microbacterium elymi]
MSSRFTGAVTAVVGVLVGGALMAAPAAASSAPAAASEQAVTTTLNGYRNVGYYGGWQATGDAKATVKKLFVDTPAAKNITHLNYAFGNIAGTQKALDAARTAGAQGLDDVEPGTCFISDQAAPAAGQTDAAGDAGNDFVRAYSADESVLGVADTKTQKLAGNFNQLRELKRLYPDLKINISLGGWSWSKSFSTAVATPRVGRRWRAGSHRPVHQGQSADHRRAWRRRRRRRDLRRHRPRLGVAGRAGLGAGGRQHGR